MDSLPQLNREFLENRKVCVTGRLVSMTHAELAELVAACGGHFLRFPHRGGMIVVLGDDGWPAESDGSPSRIFQRARRLRALGYAIEFVPENEFLARLGLEDGAGMIRGLHTMSDLTRMLGVSPGQLRRWVRIGLIEPVRHTCRLAYFDFHQIAFAKRLCELLNGGASLSSIREGVEAIRRWLPAQSLPLAHWAKLERDGRVLTRLDDVLVDNHRQKYFDFEAPDFVPLADAKSYDADVNQVARQFELAIRCEDDGQFEAAAQAYEQAIPLAPHDPVLHFNLGNVLFGLGQLEAASQSFRRAIDLDPQYAEAWNNLGSTWAAMQQNDKAISAWQTAARLVPEYADAHYNLADTLRRMGHIDDATRHWQAYQQYSAADRLVSRRQEILRVFRES